MSDLMLHPTTKKQLEHFAAQPSHALLLAGPEGIGKSAIARALSMQLLTLKLLERYPYAKILTPDERGTLSIDTIRELQHFLQLKTTGNNVLRRVAIVEHADALTVEAQNAFLKLLEEPPADTLLLLTAANMRALLPTIRSRLQTVTVRHPGEAAIKTFFEKTHKSEAIAQAYLLSGGAPGLMHALLTGDNEHPLTSGVSQAKELLQHASFERLRTVDALSKQKTNARTVIAALQRIAHTGLQQATAKQDRTRLKQWHRIRKAAYDAADAMQKNANTKLVLTHLCLQI